MKIRKNIATSESGFLFNPATGDSFSANPIASEIILMMKEGKRSDEIKQHILANYEVDGTRLEKDFDDLIAQMRDSNLLEV